MINRSPSEVTALQDRINSRYTELAVEVAAAQQRIPAHYHDYATALSRSVQRFVAFYRANHGYPEIAFDSTYDQTVQWGREYDQLRAQFRELIRTEPRTPESGAGQTTEEQTQAREQRAASLFKWFGLGLAAVAVLYALTKVPAPRRGSVTGLVKRKVASS